MYTIVDGMFISRYVGTLALSAVNMSYPLNSIELAFGIMLATGSSAVIAMRMGQGRAQTAKENFTFVVLVAFLSGVLIAVLGNIFIDPLLHILGVSDLQLALCRDYTRVLLSFSPMFFLQTAFQTLFVTAGKPHLGLVLTVLAGVSNIVLDYVFVAVFGFGVVGAAVATGIGYCVPAVIGLVYFAKNKSGTLYFVPFKPDWKMMLKTCTNGSSEMVTNVANAVTTFLFNMIFMRYYGEDGVAAITIVLYFQFVFTAVFFGFSMGVAPIISYKYGSGDTKQLKKLVRDSLIFILICSATSYLLSRIIIAPALVLFTDTASKVYDLTLAGFPIFAVSFLFMGVSSFASALFTALSEGKVSAIISFARTFLFLAGAIILLPMLIGEHGLWLSVPAAELAGLAVSIFFLLTKRQKYHY